MSTYRELKSLYTEIGYTCLQCDALHGEGLEQIRSALKDKVTLMAGNSGVGKSTLVNRILPELNQRTGEISEKHDTGMHTTEPDCAVKRAVETGQIHLSRYTSYLSMLEDEEEGKYRDKN